jgi:hypothetical protein
MLACGKLALAVPKPRSSHLGNVLLTGLAGLQAGLLE